MIRRALLTAIFAFLTLVRPVIGDGSPRAAELGILFEGMRGKYNAISDVAGVTVGHTTRISGPGEGAPGDPVIRTGVTAILPLGSRTLNEPVFAGWHSLNGNGEMTGTAWIEESGFLEGPIMLTNTHSVGTVHAATIKWRTRQGGPDATGYWWSLPVVAETWDGYLNDINGFHVTEGDAFHAIANARGGPVEEGSVGSGTGMIAYEFKSGIGTASRVLAASAGAFTVGVLVQANCGKREQLLIAGVPVGREITEGRFKRRQHPQEMPGESGSIIIVIATDAPLLPHQLKRLARRATLGLARTGSISENGSGDLFIAFSTALPVRSSNGQEFTARLVANDYLNPIFSAVVSATEEAIINALVAAETMTGRDARTVIGIPTDRVQSILDRHGRLTR
jgi:D-aminopeptidase